MKVASCLVDIARRGGSDDAIAADEERSFGTGDAFALASPAVQPWQLPNSRDEAFFFETVTLSLWQGEEEGVLGEGHARRLEGFLLCSDSCCVR